MSAPIIGYGNRILRNSCHEAELNVPDTDTLIEVLWETLQECRGVGLASPQIDRDLRAFVVDSEAMYRDLSQADRKTIFAGDEGIREAFINPKILAFSEELWSEKEACLSIPGISEPVERSWEIIIEYCDRACEFHRKQFSGFTAKVIQHEYDHLNGKLFIDHLPALKKKLLKNRLKKIREGKIPANYPIKYA